MNKTIKALLIGFLFFALLMVTTSSLASNVKEYVLVPALYPIIVNDTKYEGELPMLNFEGHTYVPLRATSDLLGTHIYWNEEVRQIEISFGDPIIENEAFRNIIVSGSNGNYTIAGQARVYEATVQYEVEDGHFILQEGFVTASEGGPEWGIFKVDIQIPEENLPEFGLLRVILFAESAEDGSKQNELSVILESFNTESDSASSLTTTNVTEYALVPALYPIVVNDIVYEGELPMLNFQGHTYVPLRATSDLLGSTIYWNEEARQVEISFGDPVIGITAFRNIIVSGSNGNYTVAGQARIFEAVLQYEVQDGHYIYHHGFESASHGAPEWGVFTIDIQIPEEKFPLYGELSLILFESSPKDGSRINELPVRLELFTNEG